MSNVEVRPTPMGDRADILGWRSRWPWIQFAQARWGGGCPERVHGEGRQASDAIVPPASANKQVLPGDDVFLINPKAQRNGLSPRPASQRPCALVLRWRRRQDRVPSPPTTGTGVKIEPFQKVSW